MDDNEFTDTKQYNIMINIDDKSNIEDIRRRNLNIIADIKPDSKVLIICGNDLTKITNAIPLEYLNRIYGIDYELHDYSGIVNFKIEEGIFPNLEYLYLSSERKDFIRSMHASNRHPNLINEIQLNNLPKTIKILYIDFIARIFEFNKPLDNLPPNLETLCISSFCFNQPLDMLPITLKKLSINSNDYNQPINNLPPGLETLYIGKNVFWSTMTFNHPLDNIPNTIKNLHISSLYGLEINKLPDMIETLTMNNKYNYKKELENLLTEINTQRTEMNSINSINSIKPLTIKYV